MKKLIVNPMPPKRATPYIIRQLTDGGSGAIPAFTASHENVKIPNCLPKNSAVAIPTGSALAKTEGVRPPNARPALNRPKIGSTANATYGCSARSSFFTSVTGIVSASVAPASVACTPDASTQNHRTTPIAR